MDKDNMVQKQKDIMKKDRSKIRQHTVEFVHESHTLNTSVEHEVHNIS